MRFLPNKILSPKLLLTSWRSDVQDYTHWCPACKSLHRFAVEKPFANGAIWSYDGNAESPTFNPSMNIVGQCHYFLHNGRIQYLPDCNHELAGQTIDLPILPERYR